MSTMPTGARKEEDWKEIDFGWIKAGLWIGFGDGYAAAKGDDDDVDASDDVDDDGCNDNINQSSHNDDFW